MAVVDAADPWTLDLTLRPLRSQRDGSRCDADDPRFLEVLEGAEITSPGPVPYVDVDSGDPSLGAVGAFVIELTQIALPGEANPISGSALLADLTFYGETRGETICGHVEGELIMPFPFPFERDNNTFGTARPSRGGGYADVTPIGACP